MCVCVCVFACSCMRIHVHSYMCSYVCAHIYTLYTRTFILESKSGHKGILGGVQSNGRNHSLEYRYTNRAERCSNVGPPRFFGQMD